MVKIYSFRVKVKISLQNYKYCMIYMNMYCICKISHVKIKQVKKEVDKIISIMDLQYMYNVHVYVVYTCTCTCSYSCSHACITTHSLMKKEED